MYGFKYEINRNQKPLDPSILKTKDDVPVVNIFVKDNKIFDKNLYSTNFKQNIKLQERFKFSNESSYSQISKLIVKDVKLNGELDFQVNENQVLIAKPFYGKLDKYNNTIDVSLTDDSLPEIGVFYVTKKNTFGLGKDNEVLKNIIDKEITAFFNFLKGDVFDYQIIKDDKVINKDWDIYDKEENIKAYIENYISTSLKEDLYSYIEKAETSVEHVSRIKKSDNKEIIFEDLIQKNDKGISALDLIIKDKNENLISFIKDTFNVTNEDIEKIENKFYVILDLETNGFESTNSVLSVYAVKCMIKNDKFVPIEVLDRYYYSEEEPNIEALKVNGLTKDMIDLNRYIQKASYPEFFKDDKKTLKDFIGNSTMISHNEIFDSMFIEDDTYQIKNKLCTMFATLEDVKTIDKSGIGLKASSLEVTAKHYEIYYDANKFHNAKYDVDILMEILNKALKTNKNIKESIENNKGFTGIDFIKDYLSNIKNKEEITNAEKNTLKNCLKYGVPKESVITELKKIITEIDLDIEQLENFLNKQEEPIKDNKNSEILLSSSNIEKKEEFVSTYKITESTNKPDIGELKFKEFAETYFNGDLNVNAVNKNGLYPILMISALGKIDMLKYLLNNDVNIFVTDKKGLMVDHYISVLADRFKTDENHFKDKNACLNLMKDFVKNMELYPSNLLVSDFPKVTHEKYNKPYLAFILLNMNSFSDKVSHDSILHYFTYNSSEIILTGLEKESFLETLPVDKQPLFLKCFEIVAERLCLEKVLRAENPKPEDYDTTIQTLFTSTNVNEKRVVDGMTPLMIACAKGNIQAVKYLIYNGAKLNETDSKGFDYTAYINRINPALKDNVSYIENKKLIKEFIDKHIQSGLAFEHYKEDFMSSDNVSVDVKSLSKDEV